MTIARVAAVVLASLLVTGTARADVQSAHDAWQRGLTDFTLERWDAAIADFEQGFSDDPRPEFLYNIARAHESAGRPVDAVRFYRKYLELASDAVNAADICATIQRLEARPRLRRRRVAIAVGVTTGVVVVGLAVGLGLGFGLRAHFDPNVMDVGPGAR